MSIQEVIESVGHAAQEIPTSGNMLAEVGQVLLVFLVLSVVFESALSPIFNWRIFRERFAHKGVKVPLTVLLAFVVFWSYGLDIFHDLLVALEYDHSGGHEGLVSFWGRVLTALLIAGGSSGIFTIFQKLGIRSPGAPPKPEPSKP